MNKKHILISPPSAGKGKRGSEGHIAYLLRQAQGAVRYALDQALTSLEITAPQFVVLNLLDAYPSASGAELARVAQLTPQTMNLIVRKLEAEGLLARSEPGERGRVLHLTLTQLGKSQLKRAKALADEVEQKILATLNPEEEVVVRRWLTQVAITLEP
jgi:DNA-binding MarR family transcriptional regulator